MIISAQREDVTRMFLRVQRIAYHYTPFRFEMDNSYLTLACRVRMEALSRSGDLRSVSNFAGMGRCTACFDLAPHFQLQMRTTVC